MSTDIVFALSVYLFFHTKKKNRTGHNFLKVINIVFTIYTCILCVKKFLLVPRQRSSVNFKIKTARDNIFGKPWLSLCVCVCVGGGVCKLLSPKPNKFSLPLVERSKKTKFLTLYHAIPYEKCTLKKIVGKEGNTGKKHFLPLPPM